jgi:hypothetical protein
MNWADTDTALESFLPDWIETAAEEARSVALGMLRERGRGAVLVGVARLDTALDVLLKAALAPPRGSETLLHADRPLGSLGAKIALAARLGLIDPAVEQSLHNLRRVRNGFAHSTAPVRLADPPYRDRLRDERDEERALRASGAMFGLFVDSMITWLEDLDGLTDEERIRWWGRIVKAWREAAREAFRLD